MKLVSSPGSRLVLLVVVIHALVVVVYSVRVDKGLSIYIDNRFHCSYICPQSLVDRLAL